MKQEEYTQKGEVGEKNDREFKNLKIQGVNSAKRYRERQSRNKHLRQGPRDSKEPEAAARSSQGGKHEEAASVNHPVKIFQ